MPLEDESLLEFDDDPVIDRVFLDFEVRLNVMMLWRAVSVFALPAVVVRGYGGAPVSGPSQHADEKSTRQQYRDQDKRKAQQQRAGQDERSRGGH
ncbi:hypothetical protein [Pseudomonas sp. BN417]|uniref:hypothetical protein n=1 Tax=Pseudomonas sp. BN417 TaxID=2567890 RepID=UPI0032AFA802